MEYLSENHPDRYKDIEKRPLDSPYMPHTDAIECPVCEGHGGWNNRIDAYGEGRHFQSMCSQCWGWGYVDKTTTDATCIHDMEEKSKKWCDENGIYHAGMCYHVQRCRNCGKISAYDSSG